VAAVTGPVRVYNEIGLLVANMEPGVALMFTPQAAQPGAFQMSGCLLKTTSGKYLLVDANQTVELRGSGLDKEVNNRVEVAGTAYRSAVPAPPASQVVQVDSLKQVGVGGCLESISEVEKKGVKVVRGEGPTTTGTTPPKSTTGSHSGVYAGVAVAAGGGIAAAVLLGRKKTTSP
ncbi:MAG: hypothetical protein HYR60_11355, partial [Acidobacteria bacterium]|nr:hypothetical protein [Acidobacteriota bacterium]